MNKNSWHQEVKQYSYFSSRPPGGKAGLWIGEKRAAARADLESVGEAPWRGLGLIAVSAHDSSDEVIDLVRREFGEAHRHRVTGGEHQVDGVVDHAGVDDDRVGPLLEVIESPVRQPARRRVPFSS